MASYQGRVDGIDAQATKGLTPRCQAFINKSNNEYIQVETNQYSLQSALELSCILKVEVEVTYEDSTPGNILTRVRVLDR